MGCRSAAKVVVLMAAIGRAAGLGLLDGRPARPLLARAGGLAAAIAAAVLLPAGPARAQDACEAAGGTPDVTETMVTCTFESPATYRYVVPSGVSSLDVTAVGARGGQGGARPPYGASTGGEGARVEANNINVTGGESLTVIVGEVGGAGGQFDNGGAGGTPGGGQGGAGTNNNRYRGGGGGGYSGLFRLFAPMPVFDQALVIAGGGGGGGARHQQNNAGGAGGAGGAGEPPDGGVGGNVGADNGGEGGGGGSTAAGGVGGMFGGFNGTPLAGGGGGTRDGQPGYDGGGGGGGGHYGGGGGGAARAQNYGGGGGGGGSSFGGTATTPDAPARVTISYDADEGTIELGKSASPSNRVRPGRVVRYTITVTNHRATAQEITVNDDLTDVLRHARYRNDATATVEPDGVDVDIPNGQLTWTGTLEPDQSAEITYSVRVRRSQAGEILSNRITGPEESICSEPEPDVPPCETQIPIAVPGPGPDLRLTKTPSPRPHHPGGQVTYTLVVENLGPRRATRVRLTDDPPSGLVYRDAETDPRGDCEIVDGGLSCRLGTLRAGGERQVILTADITEDASGDIVNKAFVSARQNGSNDTATSTIRVTPSPAAQPDSNLVVSKSVNRRRALRGRPLRYTITVTNRGPATATGVRLTDTLALPVRVLSIRSGRSRCRARGALTCRLGRLRAGARTTIRITAMPTVTGVQINTATVVSRSRDPDPRNNIASARTRIIAPTAPPPVTG